MSDHIKQNKVVALDKLTPHPRNYRSHPDAQIAKLVSSLARFGQGRSIVVQDGPHGYLIVAGHGIVEAAKKLQITELRADILPADWTSEQIDGYLIADNLHSQDAADDETMLAELLQEQQDAGYDLAALGSSDESLRQMLEALGDEYIGGSGEHDEEEDELPEKVETRAKVGDVWSLGRHRIACLNSCDPEQVRRFVGNAAVSFVWADPPYGMDMVGRQGWMGYAKPFGGVKNRGKEPDIPTRVYPPIIGDESLDTAIRSFQFCHSTFPKTLQIWWGANYYAHVLSPSSCWIVWDKENTGDFADAELAWCSDKSPVRIFKHMWNGMLKDSEHGQKRVHPSQKPIALAEFCFEKYGKEQDIIFDPFLGSGMSVIAAEKMGGNRTVIGCELSPEYIDVIITRWEKCTGQTATLLERATEVANA